MSPDATVIERLAAIDWQMIGDALNHCGYALIEHLLAPGECAAMKALYVEDTRFRNRVVMEPHGYGRGEYRYFSYPLPGLVNDLRTQAYPHLAPLADQWHAALGSEVRYPSHHAEFIARCHAAGQSKPTCLQLRYAADDYNCLHQDLYGAQVFPVQMAILLSDPERDFTGGEFIFTEQRPRRQSRAEVIPLRCINDRCEDHAVAGGSTIATASAAYGRGIDTRSVSFFTTRCKHFFPEKPCHRDCRAPSHYPSIFG
jgi:hypothetical protein